MGLGRQNSLTKMTKYLHSNYRDYREYRERLQLRILPPGP